MAEGVIPEARWLTHEAVCKARRAADGRADGLIQPAGFAGNSGKNSGFRQTGRLRRSFSRQNYCKFKVLTENRRCRRNSGEIRRNSGFRARGAESPSHEAPCGPCILRPRKRIAQSDRITPVETCEWDQIGQTPRLLVLAGNFSRFGKDGSKNIKDFRSLRRNSLRAGAGNFVTQSRE